MINISEIAGLDRKLTLTTFGYAVADKKYKSMAKIETRFNKYEARKFAYDLLRAAEDLMEDDK